MSTPSIPLNLPSAEGAQALLDHLRAQLEGPTELSEPLRASLAATTASLEKGLALMAAQELVRNKKQEWEAQKMALASQAQALCKALKKHRGEGFPFVELLPLMGEHKKSWGQLPQAARLVDEHSFRVAGYMSAPEAWRMAVDGNLAHLRRSTELLEAEAAKWKKVAAPDAKTPRIEGVLGKAIADCGDKTLGLLALLGDTAADTDMCLIEEAALYSDYGRGFQQNDLKTVTRMFRNSKRERDSFLDTFTASMVKAAEQFSEAESQAWIDERAASAPACRSPKPR